MTENTGTSFRWEVTGHEPLQIRKDLDEAVDRAVFHALQVGSHGVLVTQHSCTLYTVALSTDVPYGQIHERRKAEPRSTDRRNAGPDVLG